MSTLLVRNAGLLVTMDDAQREIPGGGLFIRNGWIEQAGPSETLPTDADEILDLEGHILLPGLINTHHHLYQTLTRVVPAAQDADLFQWLKTLYPIWARRSSAWRSWRSRAALPPAIITTSSPMAAAWTTRSRRRAWWDCACTPLGDQ